MSLARPLRSASVSSVFSVVIEDSASDALGHAEKSSPFVGFVWFVVQ